MDRRLFLRRAGLIAAGVVAADQLELLERLTWKRTLFPGTDYNDWPPGLLDCLTSTSLHDLSTATYPETYPGWNAGPLLVSRRLA